MLSIGIDLTCVDRFRSINTPGGIAFYQRVFTPQEQRVCRHEPTLLALCFSAKEAVSKVLGTGLTIGKSDHVTCLSIEIVNITSDELQVQLSGAALCIAQIQGFEKFLLRHEFIDKNIVMCAIGSRNVQNIDLCALLNNLVSALVWQYANLKN